jgi:hypothetical protein
MVRSSRIPADFEDGKRLRRGRFSVPTWIAAQFGRSVRRRARRGARRRQRRAAACAARQCVARRWKPWPWNLPSAVIGAAVAVRRGDAYARLGDGRRRSGTAAGPSRARPPRCRSICSRRAPVRRCSSFAAGRGNKTLQLAARMGGTGSVVTVELDEKKLRVMREHSNVAARATSHRRGDARECRRGEFAPTPCCSTRRAPDSVSSAAIPKRAGARRPDDGARLAVAQAELLAGGRPHGARRPLVYSVCSSDPREGRERVDAFSPRTTRLRARAAARALRPFERATATSSCRPASRVATASTSPRSCAAERERLRALGDDVRECRRAHVRGSVSERARTGANRAQAGRGIRIGGPANGRGGRRFVVRMSTAPTSPLRAGPRVSRAAVERDARAPGRALGKARAGARRARGERSVGRERHRCDRRRGAARARAARLRVAQGDAAGRARRSIGGRSSGRDAACDFVVLDARVSRRHLEIEPDGGSLRFPRSGLVERNEIAQRRSAPPRANSASATCSRSATANCASRPTNVTPDAACQHRGGGRSRLFVLAVPRRRRERDDAMMAMQAVVLRVEQDHRTRTVRAPVPITIGRAPSATSSFPMRK